MMDWEKTAMCFTAKTTSIDEAVSDAISKVVKGALILLLAVGLMPTVSWADQEPLSDDTGDDRSLETDRSSEDFALSSDSGETNIDVQQESQDGSVQGVTQLLESGTLEGGLTWEYWDDATLKIMGDGSMPDFASVTVQDWNAYLTLIEKIVIGEGVESIGDRSFYKANLLQSVELPSTLTRIGREAFYQANLLPEIDIPDSVETIGAYAFKECRSLRSCHLPDTLKEISPSLFEDCIHLQHLNIPDTLTKIGEYAFYLDAGHREYLDSLVIPASITEIGKHAFYGLRVDGDVVIPTSLSSVTGTCDFSKLIVKGTMIFEEGITDETVAKATWSKCSASRVSIPKSLTRFPNVPIAETEYQVSAENPTYAVIEGSLFSNRGRFKEYSNKSDVLAEVPNGVATYEVRERTLEIGYQAFGEKLTSVSIPASVELIATDGDNFNGEKLTAIDVDKDNAHYSSLDGVLFSAGLEEVIRCPRSKEFEHGAFDMPQETKRIAESAFDRCANLVSASISDGVERIPVKCFYECTKLASLFVPKSVKTIEKEAYYVRMWVHGDRTGLNVLYEGSEDEWSAIDISSSNNSRIIDSVKFYDVERGGVSKDTLLYYLDHDAALHIVPDAQSTTKVTEMADYDPDEPLWSEFGDRIRSVDFSSKIEVVGAHAFDGCSALEKATLPPSIVDVKAASFANCPRLTRVECEGDAFGVVARNVMGASFDETVELFYRSDATGWVEAPAYDEAARTWNGYKLSLAEDSAYPEIGSISLTRSGQPASEVTVEGGNRYTAFDLVVLSKSGEDITNKVDISIDYPTNQRRLAGNFTLDGPHELPVASVYDEVAGQVKIGSCSAEGTCTVRVSPKKYVTTGEELCYSVTVKRAAERVFDSWSWPQNVFTLSGRLQNKLGMQQIDVWNQFGESIADKVDVRVIDVNGGLDITDRLNDFGIILDGFQEDGNVRYSHMAIPRTYRFDFSPKAGEALTGSRSGYFTLGRDSNLLNKPYTLNLAGGESAIEVSEGSTWAKTPYRLSMLDCYDDPCWPDPTWVVKNGNGKDVSSAFEVDEQGYLLVTESALDAIVEGDASTPFSIHSNAVGPYARSRSSNELDFVLTIAKEPEVKTHTATFKVGDQEIGKVTFAEGDSSLEEPAMPQKDNYVGAWDEYDLASATSDIVIEGRYTPIDPDAVSDIEIEGDASYESGAVTINLAASAASKQIKVQSRQTKPLDVVLVCDQSGSMEQTLGSGETKVDALKRCATQFVNALCENSIKTKADHRVALVGFSYSEYSSNPQKWNASGYEHTGLLVTQSGGFKKFGNEAKRSYSEAFIPVAGNSGVDERIVAGINSIAAEGATAADLGLNLAKGVFAANPNTGADGVVRERVVVFITDGVPTDWSNERERMKTTGANAIQIAKDIKQGQGAHIYSIGVDAQASPSAAFWSSTDGVGTVSNTLSYDFNRFLHAVSSNYPEAVAMDALGDGAKDGGYYMAVNDTANLNKIFSSILYSTVYSIESFDRATLAYALPDGFVLTMAQEEEMRANLATQGLMDDDIIVTQTDGKTSIVFKNVKVQTEYVDGVPRYVARVSFRVSAANGVSGSIPGGNASVDENGDIKEVSLPAVTVPQDRCVLVFKVNDAIYEIRDASMGDVIELPDTDIARWMELEKKVDPKVDSAYAVFETTTLERKYSLRWVVGENETISNYAPGETIKMPTEVSGWIDQQDQDLAGWSPSLPATMPARNIACTAVMTPKHVHSFTASEWKTGSCTDGLVRYRACACGEVDEGEKEAPRSHTFDAHLSCVGNSKDITVEDLACTVCGYSDQKHVTYQVSKSTWNGRNVTVVDMSKYVNNVSVPGDSADDIEMRFFIGTDRASRNGTYTVTRIDSDGEHHELKDVRFENGYLIFKPNHFSLYVIGELVSASGSSTVDGMSYEKALAILGNPDADELSSGGPEESIAPETDTPPDSPEGPSRDEILNGGSQGDSGDSWFGGDWESDQKSLDDLLRSTITSPNGTDLSARSPKTGDPRLNRTFAPLLERKLLVA